LCIRNGYFSLFCENLPLKLQSYHLFSAHQLLRTVLENTYSMPDFLSGLKWPTSLKLKHFHFICSQETSVLWKTLLMAGDKRENYLKIGDFRELLACL